MRPTRRGLHLTSPSGFTLPGVTYILARYYTRRELIFRISLYLAGSAALAGGFGGLLASGFLAAQSFGMVTVRPPVAQPTLTLG